MNAGAKEAASQKHIHCFIFVSIFLANFIRPDSMKLLGNR